MVKKNTKKKTEDKPKSVKVGAMWNGRKDGSFAISLNDREGYIYAFPIDKSKLPDGVKAPDYTLREYPKA